MNKTTLVVILLDWKNVPNYFSHSTMYLINHIIIYHPLSLFLLMIVLINDSKQSPFISSSDMSSNLTVIVLLC